VRCRPGPDNKKTLATRRGSLWSSVVRGALALVPPRSSVLSPGAGNEINQALKTVDDRADKGEEGYLERAVLDRELDATTIARHDDGDGAAIQTVRGAHGPRSLRGLPTMRNRAEGPGRSGE